MLSGPTGWPSTETMFTACACTGSVSDVICPRPIEWFARVEFSTDTNRGSAPPPVRNARASAGADRRGLSSNAVDAPVPPMPAASTAPPPLRSSGHVGTTPPRAGCAPGSGGAGAADAVPGAAGAADAGAADAGASDADPDDAGAAEPPAPDDVDDAPDPAAPDDAGCAGAAECASPLSW